MEQPGRKSDFLGLLNEYRGAIHRVCRTYAASSEDREELVQEVIYQLWRACCWREQADTLHPRLEEGAVMRMIETRATDLRREIRRRLRREAGYYVPMIAVSVVGVMSGEFTLNKVLAACSVLGLIGGVTATLWRAERRIEDAPLDGSLRDALTRLLAQVDEAGRAYVEVYVLLMTVSAGIVAGLMWSRQGFGPLFWGVVVGGTLLVMWSVGSGRGYVERMFRRYRAELTDCLRQLDHQV